MMRLDPEFFDIVFCVPHMEKYTNISIQQGQEAYEKDLKLKNWSILHGWRL